MEKFKWGCGTGWQHDASARSKRHHRNEHIFPRLTDTTKGLVAIQKKTWELIGFFHMPNVSDHATAPPPNNFRLLLLRRLQRAFLRVAAHSMLMAITAPAHGQGSWGEGGSPWKAWWRESAQKGVSTNVPLRDLDPHAPIAANGRRLEVAWMGCHCLATAQPGKAPPGTREWPYPWQSVQGTEIHRIYGVTSKMSSGGVGGGSRRQVRRNVSSALIPTPELGVKGSSCVDARNRLGACAGVLCCLAPPPEP